MKPQPEPGSLIRSRLEQAVGEITIPDVTRETYVEGILAVVLKARWPNPRRRTTAARSAASR